ncbi:hypothetical protein EMPS_01807 [Entomortierella parvispora]|uniref:Uncharacterized protein n=1 Tax=Entomortierella parvispora TaxID=205924 RepID=A0A9P3LSW5_9FUNG|nr:hypothetical protein EMPS_01807 [Entomortierella parvispora]
MASFFNNSSDDSTFNFPVASSSRATTSSNDTTAATTSSFTARLARSQTPLPSLFQIGSSSQDSNDADEEDNDQENNDHDHQDDDDEDKEHKGRTDIGVIDLTRSSSPVFQYTVLPRTRSVSPTFAIQADKMAKRIRLSPGAESRHSEKRVRFDLSRNCTHVYDSSGSLPSSPEVICLDDPDQELADLTSSPQVLDFAQSLNRLYGGGSNYSQENNFSMSPPSSQGSYSPTRSFNFRSISPVPAKRMFFSYSPPPASSLSSSWSPAMSDDETAEDDGEDQDEDVSMQLAHKPIFSSTTPPPATPVVQEEKPRFVPRRPRDTTNRFSPTAAASEPASSSTSSSSQEKSGFVPRRPRDTTNLFSRPATVRFPSTLKREASHASFLVTAPEMLERSPSPSRTLERGSPGREEISIPALTKSLSDLSSSNIPSPPDSQLV